MISYSRVPPGASMLIVSPSCLPISARATGDEIAIDDRSATPLSLLFHELATNATKYGALSTEIGLVDITIAQDGDAVTVDWRERGGPAITTPPESGGFGSQLIEMSAVRQLGGTVTRDELRLLAYLGESHEEIVLLREKIPALLVDA